jgi:3-methyladenine DNA glycosylase AlkD
MCNILHQLPMNTIEELKKELLKYSSKEKAKLLSGFFKTEKGEYAEGDIFIGITVPDQRKTAKIFYNKFTLKDIEKLLHSETHEHRMTSLFMLILKYNENKDESLKKEIVDIYIRNKKYINNWDLVDLSAEKIIGDFLYNYKKPRDILYDFAETEHLWTQRIAVLSTFYFIRKNDFKDTFELAKILLNHKHDLIHKAVGWMLREIGKRDFNKEYDFLKKYYKKMPRTMLRYAIEKFDQDLREKFLKGFV